MTGVRDIVDRSTYLGVGVYWDEGSEGWIMSFSTNVYLASPVSRTLPFFFYSQFRRHCIFKHLQS